MRGQQPCWKGSMQRGALHREYVVVLVETITRKMAKRTFCRLYFALLSFPSHEIGA